MPLLFCRGTMLLAVKLMTALCFFVLGPGVSAFSASIPVFPGAQGFGTDTPAGRGGKIIKVRNLKDSGPDSLRAAIETAGPRIIVFEVGGTIKLTKKLTIAEPYVTISGQTAPPPGISLRGAGISVKTHDVLIQHLRIRVGDEKNGSSHHNRDGIGIIGAPAFNVVLDHLSVSWAIDENVSTWYAPHNATISNSIISEGLHHSLHPEGSHSKGILIGDGSKNISLVRNLLSHNYDRNPRLKGNVSVVVMNNVVYNGKNQMVIGSESGPSSVTAVGNVFLGGPNSPEQIKPINVAPSCPPGTHIYLEDNYAPSPVFFFQTPFDPRVSTPPLWHPSLVASDHSVAKSWVSAHAGARPKDQDEVDQRVVREVLTGKGKIIDSQQEVGGWPDLPETFRPLDIPARPHDDPDGNGYTNIEELLQRLAKEVEGDG